MNISHAAASRSRSVEPRVFFPETVSQTTVGDTGLSRSSSPNAWKFELLDRVWDDKGPPSVYASAVLTVLIRIADKEGRAWPGVQTLMRRAKIKSERTLQKALDELVCGKWLRIVPQTWASLTEVQTAAGKRAPRRGDCGQATNLYVILDGQGREAALGSSTGPTLARTSTESPETTGSPLQKDRGGPLQKDRGGPPANLHPDPDQGGSISKEAREQRVPRVETNTHISSKSSKKGEVNLEGWTVIVEAHTEKTKTTYCLPPLPPDLKRDQREALATAIDGAAAEVRAKIQQRTGVERDFAEVRRELAERVMTLYFKRDNEHLRRVKHALRDLPREFHARLTEAMQGLLRESHDVTPPRRAIVEEAPERFVSEDKPAPNPRKTQLEAPKQPIESVDKPRKDLSKTTALEARRLLEALNTSPQQELFRPSRTSAEKPKREQIESEQAQTSADKPSHDKPERKKFEDKPSPESFEDKPSSRFERPLGRTGAPRWGAIGPRPTKMRRANKLTPDDAEPEEEHGRGSTSLR